MPTALPHRHCVVLCGLVTAALVGGFVALRSAPVNAADAKPADQGRAGELMKLNLKFSGAQSCAGSGCHNQPSQKDGFLMSELTTWQEQDGHTKAMAVLEKVPKSLAKKHPELAKIGETLKITDVQTSTRCLTCHALNAPAALQGDKFDLSEGVTCASCHGPSQKWLADHKNKGWTERQREARAATAGTEEWKGQAAHGKLLSDLGLYDTKPLVARAEICVSCHLAIDPELVEAGHPQPYFELNYFQETEPKHWRELPRDKDLGHVRIWSIGQVVCFRDALNQLAARAADAKTKPETLKESLAQALAHGMMVQQAIKAKAIAVPDGLLADLSKLKDALDGKTVDVAATAKALAAHYPELTNPALAVQPTKEMATALAKAIATDASIAKDLGRVGAQQQALAVWSLVTATGVAEGDELKALADFKSPYRSDKDKFDAEAYSAALKAATPK
jgi:hypothetical protein